MRIARLAVYGTLALPLATTAVAQGHPIAEPDWKVIGASEQPGPAPKVVSSPTPNAVAGDEDDDAASPSHVIRNPNWLSRPDGNAFAQYYPFRAALARITGGARIACLVTVAGALEQCQLKREYPPGFGFGQAALNMTKWFRLSPMTVDGKPVGGGTIAIPINFLIPQGRSTLLGVVWRSAPSAAQVAAVYPPKAQTAKISGQVILDCSIGAGFRLEKCNVLSETPHGYGFSQAATALAEDFVAPPADSGGASTKGDRTQITVAFNPGVLVSSNPAIGSPHWVRIPQALGAPSTYPAQALGAHVSQGRADLWCEVIAEGRLDHCAIGKEEPAGLGFGAAALSMSGQFQMSVWTDEGLPTVGGRVDVPIHYLAPWVRLTTVEASRTTPDGEDESKPHADAAPAGPHWAHQPLPADYGAAYPPAAADLNLSGDATLHCAVTGEGRLRGCTVLKESPGGYGFGQAAVTLASYYRAAPGTGPEVTFLVRFAIPGH